MNAVYGRDIDLNLLRVFTVVAESGSVTRAATQLYLTQPAISAALRRLTIAVGAPLFQREGRGLSLTSRGERLLASTRSHLVALVEGALAQPAFDPAKHQQTYRLGLSDVAEGWILPALLRALESEAPGIRLVSMPVNFRNVADALSEHRVDMAVTVADDMPPSIKRAPLFAGGFVCLFDRRHGKVETPLRERVYFQREHVIVSYNGDLRGIVEDLLHKSRRVRCSVSSFSHIGAIVQGTALLATVPAFVARQIIASRPDLASCALPFQLAGSATELLWPAARNDDDAGRFLRRHISTVAAQMARGGKAGARDRRPAKRASRRGHATS